MNPPDVSVVVCTHNRAEMLRDALRSLTCLRTYAEFTYEVVVVDNASTDHTPEVVQQCAALSRVPVRRVIEPCPGVAYARNRGIAETCSPWIAYFDDDQLADPDWLRHLLAMAREKNARCVGGTVLLRLPPGNHTRLAPMSRWLLGESIGLSRPCRYAGKRFPGTGNVLLHRSLLDEMGAFAEMPEQRGEDTDLFRRVRAAGIPAWYAPDAVIHHVIPQERLAPAYLQTVAARSGFGLAREERQEWGPLCFPFIWGARLAQAALLFVPRLLLALLIRDQQRALAARCRLSMAAAYNRSALSLVLPNRRTDATSQTQSDLIQVLPSEPLLVPALTQAKEVS